jgi:hypothetical protein
MVIRVYVISSSYVTINICYTLIDSFLFYLINFVFIRMYYVMF